MNIYHYFSLIMNMEKICHCCAKKFSNRASNFCCSDCAKNFSYSSNLCSI